MRGIGPLNNVPAWTARTTCGTQVSNYFWSYNSRQYKSIVGLILLQ